MAMLEIKEEWFFLISEWTGIFMVLKFDLKCFAEKYAFAGLDNQPSGWYVKVRA